jgi:ribosomal-protein-alanine N-acetyltransferase
MRIIQDEAEVLSIAVAPEMRRQGVAQALLRAASTEAEWRGAASLLLDVARDNAPARAFYAQAGFAERGVRRRYYKSGADALQLVLQLPSG